MDFHPRALLIDLSGTLHVGDEVVWRSHEALARLRHSNMLCRFITNTSKESKVTLVKRLQGLGFDICENEVFSSLTAANNYVRKCMLEPYLMLEEDSKKDFDHILPGKYNAVVVGLAPKMFDYTNMNEAFRIVLNGGPLIAVNKSRYYMSSSGMKLAAGPFVSAIEFATGKEAVVIGKPSKGFFQEVLHDIGCLAEDAVMIGDDVRDDIHGAQECGIRGILVQTGKYMHGDENRIHPPPYRVVASFADAVDYLLK